MPLGSIPARAAIFDTQLGINDKNPNCVNCGLHLPAVADYISP